MLSMGFGGVDSSSHFCSHSREMKSYGEPGREKHEEKQAHTRQRVCDMADGIL